MQKWKGRYSRPVGYVLFPDGTVNGRKARALVSLVSGANVAVQ